MRAVVRAVACALLMAPILFSAAAAPADAQDGQTCLVAGNGLEAMGPFPARRATFASFNLIRTIRVEDSGSVVVAAGSQRYLETEVVRIDVTGAASVLARQGDSIAGVTLGTVDEIDLEPDGDLLILADAPSALLRLNTDGTQENLSSQLPSGSSVGSISVADDGTTYLIASTGTIFTSREFVLYWLRPDGPPVPMFVSGTQIDGASAEVLVDVAAGDGGAWVQASVRDPVDLTLGSQLVFVTDEGDVIAGPDFPVGDSPVSITPDGAGGIYYGLDRQIRQVAVNGTPQVVHVLDELVSGRVPTRLWGGIDSRLGSLWFATQKQIYRVGGGPCPPVPFNEGPTTCVVADESMIATILDAAGDQVLPYSVAVDGASNVYATLFGGEGSALVRFEPGGNTSIVAQTGDQVDGLALQGLLGVAAAATSGDVFIAESVSGLRRGRVLHRNASGEWATLLTRGDIVDGVQFTAAVELGVNAQFLYSKQWSSAPIRTEVATGESELVPSLVQEPFSIAVSPGSAPGSVVWASEDNRLYRLVGGLWQVVIDFDTTTLNGARARLGHIAASGDGVIASVSTEQSAARLIRINADATIEPIVDELMLLDDRILDFVRDVAAGPNGDVYVVDEIHDRIIRLPASGDCSTPLPPVVDLAAGVNCDDQANIVDALFIVQYEVTVRNGVYGCPLENPTTEINLNYADINGDGSVNVIDALLIAQCEVEVPNRVCPAG